MSTVKTKKAPAVAPTVPTDVPRDGYNQPSQSGAPTQRVGLIFTALILTMLMSSLGQMVFSTALPTIVGELDGVQHMSWVITAYLLAQTIALPIFGKMGDLIGRKTLTIAAVVMFIGGSILGGLAQTMGMLIVARTIQGAAGGGLMVLSQAITADVVPARQRGKYMGIMGAAFATSSVLGPLLGGWFTDGPGWRWGLWLNVPLGVIALIGIAVFLKLPSRPFNSKIDVIGIATMAIATTCLILFVTWGGRDYAWSSPVIIGLIAGAVVSAVAFCINESKAEDPLIPLSLFKNRNFALTTAAGLTVGIFLFGSIGYLPTYLQMVHALTPTDAGLMLIPMMLPMTVTSIVVGLIVTRTGRYKWFTVVGLLIVSVALFMLSRLTADDSLTKVGVDLLVLGLGFGFSFQLLVLIVQNSFPVAVVGTATATNNFIRQIGASLGSALVGGMFVANLKDNLQQNMGPAIASLGEKGRALAEQFSGSHGGAGSLTPHLVAQLPDPVHHAVLASYNDALTPIYLLLVPLAVVAAIILAFIEEVQLKDTIE